MITSFRLLIVAVIAFLLGGCAVGVKHRYDNVEPEIQTSGKVNAFALGVQDRRPYVVSGKKTQDFVGLSRGGFGNPFDVSTESGKALSEDISAVVAKALSRKGASVAVIRVSPLDSEKSVIAQLAKTGSRGVLVSIAEWKSDTYMSVSLHYDVTVSIVEPGGRIAATKRLQGTDALGTAGVNPPELSREVIPPAFKRKMEELFASPEVAPFL